MPRGVYQKTPEHIAKLKHALERGRTPQGRAKANATRQARAGGSITDFVRARVLEDNAIDEATLLEKLAEAGFAGFKRITVQTARTDCLRTIRVARELGLMVTV
jgi:hypothetical protein